MDSAFFANLKISLLSRWLVVNEAGGGGHKFPAGCGGSLIANYVNKLAIQPSRSGA